MAVRPKGTKFQVDVTVNGVRAPRVSCDTMAEARKIEAEFRAKLLAGVPPDQLVLAGPLKAALSGTIGDAVTKTYRQRWQGAKSEDSSLRNAEAWVSEWGRDFPLEKITSDAISKVCDGWGAGGNAAGTINRKLAALSVVLKMAEEDGLINRVPRMPKRKEYEGRLRYFTDREVASILGWAGPDQALEALFAVALETGMRYSELMGLIVRDVDFKSGNILLGETKGNKRRSVPMTKMCRSYLSFMLGDKRDHDNIFPARLSSSHISRVIRGWKASWGLDAGDEACFHTFRHTTCSRLVQRGVPLPVVQKFMGHADITTTMRYAHLAPDSLDLARMALEGN